MKHFMVDIETLGIKPSSVILSIGAVEFDLSGKIGDTYHRIIDVQSSTDKGLTMDASTVKWWMGQSDAARSVFDNNGWPLAAALTEFATYLGENAIIWCNGANFDAPILENAFAACNIRLPWAYYNVRDYRTIRNMLTKEVLQELRVHPTVAHNAVEDAVAQAKTLQNIFNWLLETERVTLAA